MDATAILAITTAIAGATAIVLAMLVRHQWIRSTDRDQDLEREKKLLAQERESHAQVVAENRLLRDAISDHKASASSSYHQGVKDGKQEERGEYAIQIVPFVNKRDVWLGIRREYIVGYRMQLLVKGCPSFTSPDIPLETHAEVDKDLVIRVVKTAIEASTPHGAATTIATKIAELVMPKEAS
jgi:hypothetical protein